MLENLTNLIQNLTELNIAIVSYVPSLIGVAAVIARFLPPQTSYLGKKVHKFANWLGQNAGYAENKQ